MIEATARTPAVSGLTGKRCRGIAQDKMMTASNGEPRRRDGTDEPPRPKARAV